MIETSGLADPAPILRTFLQLRARGSPLRVDGTVVVVDVHALLSEGGFDVKAGAASGGGGGLSRVTGRSGFSVFGGSVRVAEWWSNNASATRQLRRQLAFADTVVVNKLDLLPSHLLCSDSEGGGDDTELDFNSTTQIHLCDAARQCVLGVVRSTAGAALRRDRVLFTSRCAVNLDSVLSLRTWGGEGDSGSSTDDARVVELLVGKHAETIPETELEFPADERSVSDSKRAKRRRVGGGAKHIHVDGVRSVSLYLRLGSGGGGGGGGGGTLVTDGLDMDALQHFLQDSLVDALGKRLLRIKGAYTESLPYYLLRLLQQPQHFLRNTYYSLTFG